MERRIWTVGEAKVRDTDCVSTWIASEAEHPRTRLLYMPFSGVGTSQYSTMLPRSSNRLSTLLLVKPRESRPATGQSRPTGGHHFLLTLNVFIMFQEPSACIETVNAI